MMNLEEALKEALKANKVLIKEIEALKKEIAELREQLNNNSNNSSLPPSQDMKKKPKKRAPKNNKGKSHGGQPGHKGKARPLAPPEA